MRKPNRSTAVMQRRLPGTNDALDDFPTPPWAVRALMEHVIPTSHHHETVWEPTANRGYMAQALGDYFRTVLMSDVADYELMQCPLNGQRFAHNIDFLDSAHRAMLLNGLNGDYQVRPDWIITNPPFRLAQDFATAALTYRAELQGVALLVRTTWLEGIKRWEELFNVQPPSVIAQFTERVPMVQGRYDPKASTATSYCWVVWETYARQQQPIFMWIPPCKRELERDGDAMPR